MNDPAPNPPPPTWTRIVLTLLAIAITSNVILGLLRAYGGLDWIQPNVGSGAIVGVFAAALIAQRNKAAGKS